MVKLRLKLMGSKKFRCYRVVASDVRSPRDGRFIEELGYYDPTKEPAVVSLKMDRINWWLSSGAQPTDTVRSLIRRYSPSTG